MKEVISYSSTIDQSIIVTEGQKDYFSLQKMDRISASGSIILPNFCRSSYSWGTAPMMTPIVLSTYWFFFFQSYLNYRAQP